MRISGLDLAILLLYLAAITLFGIHFRRNQNNLRDYFLGGRTVPWWALAGSIVATETSTLTIVGTPAIAYAGNLGFLQLVIGYLVARVVISLLFIPQYFRGEFYTAYQLIEKRFGARMRSVAAAIFLVTRALAEGVRINAIGKVVSVAFSTGADVSVAGITALTILYTFEGGLRAVIWTDLAQLVLYLGGSAMACYLVLGKIPGGWAEVTRVAAATGKFRIFDFSLSLTQTYTFWSGVVGGTFLTLASHGTDQTMVQRLLAARSERDSKKALLTSGVVIFFQFALFLVLGVMLYVYAQHFPLIAPGGDRDRLLPEFIVREMPPGVAGLLLAAILAVAMSNASGSLNSLASSTVLDFKRVQRFVLGIGGAGAQKTRAGAPSSLLRFSRWTTAAWGAIVGGLALLHWGPVLEAGLTIASISYGCLLGLFLLGVLSRRATARGALAGMLAGLAAVLVVDFAPRIAEGSFGAHWPTVAWTWYVLIGATVTFSVGLMASLAGLLTEERKHPSAPA